MVGKSPSQIQRSLFNPLLSDFIDTQHELVLLAEKIDWTYFEKEFSKLYSNVGKPSMPIRFSVGCLMLKHIYNLGDETLAKDWVRDPYMQYFTGEAYFQHKFLCDPSDFVHFRKRIGKQGIEKIFYYTVKLFGKQAKEKQMLSDTTVQGNNTTYPTDSKLSKKIIEDCNKIAKKENINQRQSYKRVSKQLVRESYNAKHPRRIKKARKAIKKIKTIAGRCTRELERKLSKEALNKYEDKIELMKRFLSQNVKDKNKLYSFYKSFTSCISKGKADKAWEFGNEVGIVVGSKSLIVTAVKSFKGNIHDSKTIEPLLNQMKEGMGYMPEEIIYDRGGRGRKEIKGVRIETPGVAKKTDSNYQKQKQRKKFRRRAAIEPVIGHLKSDHRMSQNYYWGEDSPEINALLACSGWNLKKMMKKLKEEFFCLFYYLENLAIFFKNIQFLGR